MGPGKKDTCTSLPPKEIIFKLNLNKCRWGKEILGNLRTPSIEEGAVLPYLKCVCVCGGGEIFPLPL